MSPSTKSPLQIRALFGLAKAAAEKSGCDPKEYLEELASEITDGRVERLSLLSFDEANAMIRRLGGQTFTSVEPRRTVNHRRQEAGVPQIAQSAHLKLMADLARGRGIGDEGLERLCRRMLRGAARPRTTAETNKIIEALKAMNARDASSKEAA